MWASGLAVSGETFCCACSQTCAQDLKECLALDFRLDAFLVLHIDYFMLGFLFALFYSSSVPDVPARKMGRQRYASPWKRYRGERRMRRKMRDYGVLPCGVFNEGRRTSDEMSAYLESKASATISTPGDSYAAWRSASMGDGMSSKTCSFIIVAAKRRRLWWPLSKC